MTALAVFLLAFIAGTTFLAALTEIWNNYQSQLFRKEIRRAFFLR